ncbi:SURP and G-patch domain-containing protein 1-like protein isoform X2 [Impatiens glandulifera]|uniref:SURP and G-patch domain-containing protein 1-like protein isoform X2 n=1 Tax=Impatiens glandulifera TaxID=253017 RepID=UPI001FB058E0|nr:SURP and G-patch domain-containing protein 1-like protein isoform X2 [Impatiens glandulifera]
MGMEKEKKQGLFVNDGSFMERFKQLQQEKGVALPESRSNPTVPETSTPKPVINRTSLGFKPKDSRKDTPVSSGGKLAFSLKQKTKLVAPSIKLSEDDDEEEKDADSPFDNVPTKRQKLGQPDITRNLPKQPDVAPRSPSDPGVKKAVDHLAIFVAKHGRQFENVTRQKNPGDTPFKFLFDESCADYKYYEYRLREEEKALSQTKDSQTSQSGGSGTTSLESSVHKSRRHHSNYQIPTSALYDSEDKGGYGASAGQSGEFSAASDNTDSVAMMEFFMKKAAQEEKRRPPKQSKDEMPPPASIQGSGKKGHHMGDYIPQEELEKFMSSCNDAAAQKATKEAVEKARIQSDNVGHKLLSKMGWKEGEGLGSSRSGIANPIMAGDVKLNNLGVGASQPGEVKPDDDIYEQYKKRMMLGYRHRPNPLNNPRKAYY